MITSLPAHIIDLKKLSLAKNLLHIIHFSHFQIHN